MSAAPEPALLLAFQGLEPVGTGRFDWRHPEVRRAQSLAARAALARAANAAGPAGPPGEAWETHPDGGLAPRVDARGRIWFASLSHARQGAVAALRRDGAVGVDLERADRPRPLHVADKLAELGAERAPLDDLDRLLALWTRVEALLKRERVGLAGWTRIRVPPAVPPTGEATLTFDERPRWTHAERLGDHWLACAAERPCERVLLPPPEPLPLRLPEAAPRPGQPRPNPPGSLPPNPDDDPAPAH